MSDEWMELAQRLVVGRKRDGRCVYDERAKLDLVMAARQPGVSVAAIARGCGVNANQVSRWLREHEQRQLPKRTAEVAEVDSAFVEVRVQPALVGTKSSPMTLQARLPNGVVLDVRDCEMQSLGAVLEMLARLTCSASTTG
jgi:transposase